MKLRERIIACWRNYAELAVMGGCNTSSTRVVYGREDFLNGVEQLAMLRTDRWGSRVLWEDE
jgi:hypothetical protein